MFLWNIRALSKLYRVTTQKAIILILLDYYYSECVHTSNSVVTTGTWHLNASTWFINPLKQLNICFETKQKTQARPHELPKLITRKWQLWEWPSIGIKKLIMKSYLQATMTAVTLYTGWLRSATTPWASSLTYLKSNKMSLLLPHIIFNYLPKYNWKKIIYGFYVY